ncbi:MAG: electron transfer flavoprotein subunit alpha/FixB family protein [Cyclobacteriaceae bacterium]
MSILVFIETDNGQIKKSSFEAISYAAAIKQKTEDKVTALVPGEVDNEAIESLGKYGANKVLHAEDKRLNQPQIQPIVTLLVAAMNHTNADILIMAKSSLGDIAGSRVSVAVGAAIANNVVELPDLSNGFTVKRSIYTGKAFATVSLGTGKKIIGIQKNTVPLKEDGEKASIEKFAISFSDSDFAAKITGVEKASDDVLLTEAEIVVSGGRGLKGPENWGMIEALAKSLGAALGCSKPVSDLEWRPHHEHVGQTGVKVSPNLYIAIGISGAIQHLAGVSASKVIVAINKDEDAPFFKAADYGIVGDAFEVVPKLTEAINALKN